MKKPNYYKQILSTLTRLNKICPSCNIGKHLSTALDGHDMWGITDKNFLQALTDYEVELETDVPNDDIEDIIKRGMNLNNILEEEEEY